MAPLNKIKICGRGVDLLDARKESDDARPVMAADLRASIARVKDEIFSAFKMLTKSCKEIQYGADMETVNAQCRSCGGTGVYCGFCEPPGTGVICVTCGGTGCEEIRYTPFNGIKRKRGVKTISVSGTSVSYNDWFRSVK